MMDHGAFSMASQNYFLDWEKKKVTWYCCLWDPTAGRERKRNPPRTNNFLAKKTIWECVGQTHTGESATVCVSCLCSATPSAEHPHSFLACSSLPRVSRQREMQSIQASQTFFWKLPEKKPLPYLESQGGNFGPECLWAPQPWCSQTHPKKLGWINSWFCCWSCRGGFWQVRRNFFLNNPLA